MLPKRRLSSSISTVHFKRQLLFPPTVEFSTETTTNGSKPSDPHHRTPQSLPTSRLRALMSLPESTQFHNSHLIYSKALKISAKMGFLSEAKQLQVHLLKTGFCNNPYLQNQIMTVYLKCQEFNYAHKVFDEMPERNVVIWNSLICSVIDETSNQKSRSSLGLSYFKAMLIEPTSPDDITLNAIIRACVETDINKQLHCFVAKLGFGSNPFVATALVDSYAKCRSVEDSKRAFDDVLCKDSVLFNSMVYCYASNRLTNEAFNLFNSTRLKSFTGDEFTFATLITSCRDDFTFILVTQIHGIAIKRALSSDTMVSTALIDAYLKKNENAIDARKVFDETTVKNIVTFNAIVVGHRKIGKNEESFELYREMIRERLGFGPDDFTLSSVASSCGDRAIINELTQVHVYAVKSGFDSFLSVNNSMINAYSKCGDIIGAFRCFELALDSDLFTWTSIISACAFHGFSTEATEYFDRMLSSGINPDKIAFLAVLSACSHRGLVKKGLGYFEAMNERFRIVPEKEHYACLVDLLGRAGLIDHAFAVLNSGQPEDMGSSAFGAFLGACNQHRN